MNSKKFDVIIFGASGFVGKCAVLQALDVLKGFDWAIAGRSQHKLQLVLNEISLKTGQNLTNIPIFLANAYDLDKLEDVVAKCKVLVNCCGPYQLWAENILTTCIMQGTHYVDMSNDPYFNELIELKYHEKALVHKVFVISSCGFHSFPMEVALNYVREHFNGTVNSVDAFVRYNFGYYFYFPLHSIWSSAAWFSLLWSCAKVGELSLIRDELRQEHMPNLWPRQAIEELSHRSKYQEEGIMVNFPFIDQQSVERSQYFWYVHNRKRPIQFCKYIEFPSYFWAFLFIIWCLIICILAQFDKTRKIMNNYPKLFSIGLFSEDGPNPYLLEMSSYKIKLQAKGWSGAMVYPKLDINDHFIVDRHMNIEISGENPFYGCGCVCMLVSARTILEEPDKMPGRGGVYSPGYAFHNTSIIDKFQNFQNYLRIRVL
ncbi:lipid droplet localized protein-like [Calliphora vicina]|uniref:lipid droplet localized protein-like n=1 Tax=Calliphora vicina TaxID=7373 RepID=UPI00325B22BD